MSRPGDDHKQKDAPAPSPETSNPGIIQFDAALQKELGNLPDTANQQAVDKLFGQMRMAADGSYLEVQPSSRDGQLLLEQALTDASTRQALDSTRGAIPGGIVYDDATGVYDLEASRESYTGPYMKGSHHFEVHQNSWTGERIDGTVDINWRVPAALEPGTYKVHDVEPPKSFIDQNTGERIEFPPGMNIKMDGQLHVEADGRRWFEGTIQYPYRKNDGTFEYVNLKCDKRNPFVLNQDDNSSSNRPSDNSSGF